MPHLVSRASATADRPYHLERDAQDLEAERTEAEVWKTRARTSMTDRAEDARCERCLQRRVRERSLQRRDQCSEPGNGDEGEDRGSSAALARLRIGPRRSRPP